MALLSSGPEDVCDPELVGLDDGRRLSGGLYIPLATVVHHINWCSDFDPFLRHGV